MGFCLITIGSAIFNYMVISHVNHLELPRLTMSDLRSNGILRDVASEIFPHDLMLSLLGITTAFLVWSIMIWVYSIKEARNLSLRESVICSLIPALIMWFVQAYGVLVGAGRFPHLII